MTEESKNIVEEGDVCTFNLDVGKFPAGEPVVIGKVTKSDTGFVVAFELLPFPKAAPYSWQQRRYLSENPSRVDWNCSWCGRKLLNRPAVIPETVTCPDCGCIGAMPA